VALGPTDEVDTAVLRRAEGFRVAVSRTATEVEDSVSASSRAQKIAFRCMGSAANAHSGPNGGWVW
jgi:hypothetical protein